MNNKRLIFLFILLTACYIINAQVQIAWITAEPDTIYADDNLTYSEITVKVVDDDSLGVQGVHVSFDTDLGNILYNDYTNNEGIATSTFWESDDIGTATITITVGELWEQINVVILPLADSEDDVLTVTNFIAYPNPFNPGKRKQFTIEYSCLESDPVTVEIFDVKGRIITHVKVLNPTINDFNKFYWDGKDKSGNLVKNGIYLFTVKQRDIKAKGKITLLN